MGQNNDLVSVIITTYKRTVQDIRKAIYSVLNQTYSTLEIIIVDDSPNDYPYRNHIKEFCKAINDTRIIYIQHTSNLGACAARNTGIAHSHGIYISFLDDDDEYLANRIELMIDVIKQDKKIVLVYCNANIIELDSGKVIGKFFKENKQYRGDVFDKIMASNFIGSTSLGMVRAEALKKINGFDPSMVASQDWDVWIRLSKIGKVDYLSEALVNYYIHSGIRISNNINNRIAGLIHLNEKCSEELSKNKVAATARKKFELHLHVMNSDIQSALRCYKELWKLQPTKVLDNIIAVKSFGRFMLKKKE
ncbi:MAG: glycosyltransferase [Lachnospiraceae bacterium]|nr:glycosyltransferase [Lachnospiraceae bacterium]